jgi:hypothetical protein
MAKKKKQLDPLIDLLEVAKQETLIKLITGIAEDRPDVRRECFDYLKKHISLTAAQKTSSEGEIVMSLWWELYPGLEELDDYGGGDYETEDQVATLLHEIQQKLEGRQIEEAIRLGLLNDLLPFIKSGNAGMDDSLYELAYAACYTDEDWRRLAQALESLNREWPMDHARRIYRKLGDRQKYLDLRRKKLVYGGDYYDLATFYWNEGNRADALAVAEEGMKKGQGRMDELRTFLADRAYEEGDRERYLSLQYEQTADSLSLDKYKSFEKICTAEEWGVFEPKLLVCLDQAWVSERLKIRMYRKEYEQALGALLEARYPCHSWDSNDALRTAKELEPHYPEQILTYYLSGLGNLNSNAARKEYAERAKVMLKVRHMLVDIVKDEKRWKSFAGKVKRDNLRRPAFQEEFAKAVPGWRELL